MIQHQIHSRRFYDLMVIAIFCMTVIRAESAAFGEPQPGDFMEVRVDTSDGPVAVRFRYCPPGEVMRGKPRELPKPTGKALTLIDRVKRKTLLSELKGFYIGETEVSQQQFERLLGKETLERVFQGMVTSETGGRGDEFPIRGVTVIDAATFCESLGNLDGENVAGRSSLEARRVRLPTHDEWQYACRAVGDVEQTSKFPHFNAWPELKDVPKDVVEDCKDVWKKKLNESEAFVGSQDQVVRVIESHDGRDRGVVILSAFLNAALGTERNYATAETQPRLVASGNQNNWNILNMHGNVFEWTIAERTPEKVEGVWEMLVAGDEAALSGDTSKSFFLAGGSYNSALGRKVSDWITFSIWGGQPMKEGAADAYSFSDLKTDNIVQDSPPGFRVLLERVLARDWLFVIREATIMNEKDNLKAIQDQLSEHRRLVAELSTGKDRKIAEARISFYEALENYRKGNRAEGARLLSGASDSLAGDDPFFSHFQQLVQADAQ
jgi:formylglycine-generating enzyme required for sulfatase activity